MHRRPPSSRASSALPYLITAFFWASSLLSLPTEVSAIQPYVPYLPQGFFFDWIPDGQSPPVPTTGKSITFTPSLVAASSQCETIHIKWSRSTAQGPNPTAPYYLQIYSSAYVYPLIVPAGSNLELDFPVPFIPGTIYEICMFDSNGVTGGCQATYTVYQAPNSTLANPPTCSNFTFPQSSLGVDAQVDSGPMSQFGWIDQCTDIAVTPTNGTPPYTFTVAPALHPPYNLTLKDKGTLNWTVALQYGMPFFVSLTDSTGLSWANGPLHAGSGGTTDCLVGQVDNAPHKQVSEGVAIGSGVGGLAVGLIVGYVVALCFAVRKKKRLSGGSEKPDLLRKTSSMSGGVGGYTDVPTTPYASDNSRDRLMREGLGYQVEPFQMPSEFGGRPVSSETSMLGDASVSGYGYDSTNPNVRSRADRIHSRNSSRSAQPLIPIPASLIPTIPPPPSNRPTTGRSSSVVAVSDQHHPHADGRPATSTSPESGVHSPTTTPQRPGANTANDANRVASHVYVVHHDAGRAPVTVYTEEGTEVVELPPRYAHTSSAPPAEAASHTPPRSPAPASGGGGGRESGVTEEPRQSPSETDSHSTGVPRGGVAGGRVQFRETRQPGSVPEKSVWSVISNQ